MRKEIELKLKGNTRRKLRENLIQEFLKEKAGKGTGDRSSKYFYFVEKLNDDRKIFLQRPANLNKGFDFDINVTETVFEGSRKKTRPTHNHITNDLRLKKSKNRTEYKN